MTRTEKKGNLFYPGIDTNYDRLGLASEFSMEITKASDGTIVNNIVPFAEFEEVIMTFDLHTAEVLEDTNSGRKTFKVKNSNLVIGDKIKIQNNFYNIIKIQNETITINGKLIENLTENESIETVGNTGIYKIPVQLETEGFYFCTIFHRDFGHSAIKYKITSSNTQDLMEELNLLNIKLDNKGFI